MEVKKLPLGKYSELLKAFQKLPGQLNSIVGVDKDQIISKIPTIIGDSLPDFLNVFKVATDITDAELDQIGLNEAVDIFVAILEVNQYQEVYEKIKKVGARFQSPVKPKEIGSIPQ